MEYLSLDTIIPGKALLRQFPLLWGCRAMAIYMPCQLCSGRWLGQSIRAL